VTSVTPQPEPLEIHPASPAEREASFHNTHDVWSRGMSLVDHVALRLKSPMHARANWFVGCIGGQVVTSLACHPLEFSLGGRRLTGFGIGTVHTLREFRRRGFAPRLLAWVEAYRRKAGDQLSLLYSDIDPQFYARLGYRQAPAWHGWRDLSDTASAPDKSDASGDGALELTPFDGRNQLEAMDAMYHAYHGARPLSIARTTEYWLHLFERRPEDEFFWLLDESGERRGYVRVNTKAGDLQIADYAFQGDAAAEHRLADALYRQVIALGQSRGAKRAGGWLPDSPTARAWFDIDHRDEEIPMFKPLDDSVVLDDKAIARTDCFCELDHV
jgi:predicted N-acetyltransferase YhbS